KAKHAPVKRLRKLQRSLLYGTLVKACGGPRKHEDQVWARNVLKAIDHRAKGGSLKSYRKAILRAQSILPPLRACLPRGFLPGAKAFEVIGRIPTAAYPSDVEVTAEHLVWLASKGVGTGPNPEDQSIKELLTGRVGVLTTPTDRQAVQYAKRADKELIPTD